MKKILVNVDAPYQFEIVIREGLKNYITDDRKKIDKQTLRCIYPYYVKEEQYRLATEEDIKFYIKKEKLRILRRYEVELQYHISILKEIKKQEHLSESFFEDLHNTINYLKEDLQSVVKDLNNIERNN